jgi:osmotically-inducible protein OsmY
VLQSRSLPSSVRALLIAALGVWPFLGRAVSAGEVAAPMKSAAITIIVTGKKPPESLTDAELKDKIQTVLHSDPYFYDAHVTVAVKDGVVHLEGVVYDDWDLRTAKRLSKKVGGAKRIVSELQICACDGGGGA